MVTKFMILACLIVIGQAAIIPAPLAVAPYASSYNAHTVHHAVAHPVSAPIVAAAPAPIIAAPTLLRAAAPAPLLAAPALLPEVYSAYSSYSGLPATYFV